MAVGFSTLKICSAESRPVSFARSHVPDDVKRSLDDIIAAERGLARPIRFIDSWDDAEMLLLREAVDLCPG